MDGFEFLKQLKSDSVHHSSASLLSHLTGTHKILLAWNCPDYLAQAGLFHSIYGTESFEKGLVSVRARQKVWKIIGKQSEKLAYLFGCKTAESFKRTVDTLYSINRNNLQNDDIRLVIEDRFTQSRIDCSPDEISDLCAMILANAVEQAHRYPELLHEDFQPFIKVAADRFPQIASFFAEEKEIAKLSSKTNVFRVVRFLNWDLRIGALSNIKDDYKQHIIMRVERKISELANDNEDLSSIARRLPPFEFERFALAPATYNYLVSRVKPYIGDTAEFARQSMIAELLRLGIKQEHKGVWTALGDEYFPAGYEPIKPKLNVKSNNSIIERHFIVPKLFEQIPVDTFSPYSILHLPDAPPRETSQNEVELNLVQEKIKNAFYGIELFAPNILDFILLVTQTIAVKVDTIDPNSFGSSSWSWLIGKIGLSNPHLDTVTIEMLANALVHEAIHSILYIVETGEPFIIDETCTENIRVISPWSGRDLALPSFLHACFVWYGLFKFWTLASKDSRFSITETERLLKKSVKGFFEGSLVDNLKAASSSLNTDVLQAIDSMQSEVLTTQKMIKFK